MTARREKIRAQGEAAIAAEEKKKARKVYVYSCLYSNIDVIT